MVREPRGGERRHRLDGTADRRVIQLSPDAQNIGSPRRPGHREPDRLQPDVHCRELPPRAARADQQLGTLSQPRSILFPKQPPRLPSRSVPRPRLPPEAGTVAYGVKATPHHEPNRSEAEEGVDHGRRPAPHWRTELMPSRLTGISPGPTSTGDPKHRKHRPSRS